jgi:hypothetical protein
MPLIEYISSRQESNRFFLARSSFIAGNWNLELTLSYSRISRPFFKSILSVSYSTYLQTLAPRREKVAKKRPQRKNCHASCISANIVPNFEKFESTDEIYNRESEASDRVTESSVINIRYLNIFCRIRHSKKRGF